MQKHSTLTLKKSKICYGKGGRSRGEDEAEERMETGGRRKQGRGESKGEKD